MTTTTSYSETGRFFSLWKGTLWRRKGEFALVSALVLIFYPLQYLLEAFRRIDPNRVVAELQVADPYYLREIYGFGRNYTQVSTFFFPAIMIVVPILLALVLNSYMHNKRAADVFHALPVRRQTLLGANFAAAMTILWTPAILSYLVISLVQFTRFGGDLWTFGQLWIDALGWFAASASIYAVATLACVLSGTIFNSFVYTGALLLTVPTLCGLYLGLSTSFLHGFVPSEIFFRRIFLLSPASVMPTRLVAVITGSFGLRQDMDPEILAMLTENNWAILGYLLFAAVVFYGAMVLYSKRKSEQAANATTRGILPRLVQMVGVLVFGLCVGMFFYAIDYAKQESVFFIWTAVGALFTFLILEAIFSRGFRTIRKSLPIGGLMLLITMIAPLTLMTGGLGFETRVPQTAEIESVEMDYRGYLSESAEKVIIPQSGMIGHREALPLVLADPANIELVRAYHQQATGLKNPEMAPLNADGSDGVVYQNHTITYRLKNGGNMVRRYRFATEKMAIAHSQLDVSAEYLQQQHPAYFVTADQIENWSLGDPYGGRGIPLYTLTIAQGEQLLAAMRQDLEALDYETLLSMPRSYGVLRFETQYTHSVERGVRTGQFYLSDPSQQTYRYLDSLGLLDEINRDIDDCIAAVVELSDRYGTRHGQGGIMQPLPEDYRRQMNLTEWIAEIERERRDLRERIEADHVSAVPTETVNDSTMTFEERVQEWGGSVTALFEDPAQIKLLADHVVSFYPITEKMVYVTFYFDRQSMPSTVAVPYSALTPEMQEQLTAAYYLKDLPIS